MAITLIEPAREELLARAFLGLADTSVDDMGQVELSQMLVACCVELFDASDAALLLCDADGTLRLMASSSDCLRLVELFEVQSGEGPGAECVAASAPVVIHDLALDAGRSPWPRFAAVALGAGYHSVQALPVGRHYQVVGTLNLFRVDAGPMAPLDVLAAQAFADATGIAVRKQRALRDAQLQADQLQAALQSRVVIEQAKGLLAGRTELSLADAFVHLRRYARHHNVKLASVCERIIDGTLSFGDLDTERRA